MSVIYEIIGWIFTKDLINQLDVKKKNCETFLKFFLGLIGGTKLIFENFYTIFLKKKFKKKYIYSHGQK